MREEIQKSLMESNDITLLRKNCGFFFESSVGKLGSYISLDDEVKPEARFDVRGVYGVNGDVPAVKGLLIPALLEGIYFIGGA